MTIPDPTYITAQEVKANSKITGLIALENADIEYLIQTAEDHIDGFVGRQKHHPYDDNIERVFPREEDYRITSDAEYPLEHEIPYLVSKACLAQVEHLYLNWWPNRETSQTPIKKDISEQDIG